MYVATTDPHDNLMAEVWESRPLTIKTIRVLFWYVFCAESCGTFDKRKLEKALDPQQDRAPGQPRRPFAGKWRHYENGSKLPQAALVRAVGRRVRGSDTVFNHAFWKIADPSLPIEKYAEAWADQLPAATRKVLFSICRVDGARRVIRIPTLTPASIRALQRARGFDALAALLLYFREAQRRGDRKTAFELVPPIVFQLALLVSWNPHGPLPGMLYSFLADHFLADARWNGLRYELDPSTCGFPYSVICSLAGVSLGRIGNEGTPAGRMRLVAEFLDDPRASHWRHMMDPILALEDATEPPPVEATMAVSEQQERFKAILNRMFPGIPVFDANREYVIRPESESRWILPYDPILERYFGPNNPEEVAEVGRRLGELISAPSRIKGSTAMALSLPEDYLTKAEAEAILGGRIRESKP